MTSKSPTPQNSYDLSGECQLPLSIKLTSKLTSTPDCSGRIMMEAQRSPVIIPMWLTGAFALRPSLCPVAHCPCHTGFDKLMPEGRPSPYKFFPRPGAALSVTFGKPVPTEEIVNALATVAKVNATEASPDHSECIPNPMAAQQEARSAAVAEHGWLRNVVQATSDVAAAKEARRALDVSRVRSAVTAVVQRRVEALGRQVLGIH